jgi:hypothetical protein
VSIARLPAAALLLAAAAPAATQPADPSLTARIIDEATTHSQVMPLAQHLTDRIGARLTNAPGMRQAEAWTQAKFAEWGLSNIRRQGFEFGRGWSIERSNVRMLTPRPITLTAIPIPWTPATAGPLSAPVILAPIRDEKDLAKWRGRLRGKIVLLTGPGEIREPAEPVYVRLSGQELRELDQFQQPKYDPAEKACTTRRFEFARALDTFLDAEGALAYATMSRADGKLVQGMGYLFGPEPARLPGVEIAAEDYRRLARLTVAGPVPTLEIDTAVRFEEGDTKAYNILADIPGTDSQAGYVMAGAHLDSWAAADGATDNAAGVAMVMEAARIIAALKVRPKRTIRFALWAGEEQGLMGSLAYVEEHLARRGGGGGQLGTGLPRLSRWLNAWPVQPLPGWRDLSAYFNLDNGTGKIRGITVENNLAVVPIFQQWLAPFGPMGADTLAIQQAGGTDHVMLRAVGIPAFQFIQDWLDYGRTHHTSADTFDHLKGDDMRQGAMILAAFLVNAANADQPLPRLPLPTQPVVTEPFSPETDCP